MSYTTPVLYVEVSRFTENQTASQWKKSLPSFLMAMGVCIHFNAPTSAVDINLGQYDNLKFDKLLF